MTKFITHEQIAEHIRRERDDGVSVPELAKKYGCTYQLIMAIMRGSGTFRLTYEMINHFNLESPRPHFKRRTTISERGSPA